ncbi:MAG TPA: hypothetical protein ENJ40_04785 [Thermosulfurimonas dismutans]|uniref:Polysaccharide chain length determinant N-terminal domain-containing protein n=1 Tax=Thermosulfurimonas dismutans TaxID=999894 RepID=A0A7C3GEQ8_9BACT|nr:hypothetical protein [Thermosulfurimonas dismutans]
MAEEKREVPVCPAAGPFYAEDEIDLYELFLVLWRRKKVIFLTLLAFMITGGLYVWLSPRVYRQTILVKLPINNLPLTTVPLISNEEAKEMINSLEELLREQNYSRLAKVLKLPEEKVRALVRFSPRAVRGSSTLLKITIEAYDPLLLPVMDRKLISFINENPYLKDRIKIWKTTIKEKEKTISVKLSNLEKLKNYLLAQIQKGKLQLLGFNPLDLEGYILDLKQELEVLKAQERLISGAELVVAGALPRRPAKPRVGVILAAVGVAGIFVGIFLAFFVEWWEKAREEHRKNLEK